MDDFGKRYRLIIPNEDKCWSDGITITDGGAEIIRVGLPAWSSAKNFGENANLPTNRIWIQRLQDMVDFANKAYEGK